MAAKPIFDSWVPKRALEYEPSLGAPTERAHTNMHFVDAVAQILKYTGLIVNVLDLILNTAQKYGYLLLWFFASLHQSTNFPIGIIT